MHRDSVADAREEVAIVGMAGHFPGAQNVNEFWANIRAGVESVTFFTPEELKSSGVDPAVLEDPDFVNAAALMEGADKFDAAFFGINTREAEIMDPQHRVLLECAWEALENAGYSPESYPGAIGVFVGVGPNTYFENNLVLHRELLEMVGSYQTMLGNTAHFPATRISFKLNLKGPSINVQNACSTSGVAIHLACQSLLGHECDMALAGGARIRVPLRGGYLYTEDGIPSPDGHCRAFDANAAGTIYGSGVAMVVLKRLSDAIEDGDFIYAVIKGSAINNDGSMKVGFTAPSVSGQSAAIAEAHAVAEVEADTIGYVEAHGTGTKLGDPIEIAALTKAFRRTTDKRGFCAIGSVKSNIGHLDAAAGAAGVIKAALALKFRTLPPAVNFEKPNPQIDFQNSPFYVNVETSEWKANGTLRRAGVSSFGLGGTNAHIILEESPDADSPSAPSRPWQLLLLSAKTDTALENVTTNLVTHLKQRPDSDLADVAYTLHVGRQSFNHRRMLVCQDIDDAVAALESPDPKRVITQSVDVDDRSIAFMFPGGGAQYVNMGLELYREEPQFREQVDQCLYLLRPHIDSDLRGLLFPNDADRETAEEQINRPSVALPVLFTMEYAMAKLLISWGIQPAGMIGHSMGEYTAACLAGVMSLEEALALVALRGRLFEKLAGGGMLSVPISEEEALGLVGEGLSIAAVNTPSSCVISGNTRAIDRLAKKLTEKEIEYRPVQISVAAHSQMVEPIRKELGQFFEKVQLRAPNIPYVSNVTGTWIRDKEAMDPAYWVRHLRQAVRFSDGVSELLKEPARVLLEVGPGQTLSTLARQHPAKSAGHAVISTLRHPKEQVSDEAYLLNSVGRLWLAGVKIDGAAFFADEQRHRVPLPTYPFERKRYWIEPPTADGPRTTPRSINPKAASSQISSTSIGYVGAGADLGRDEPMNARPTDAPPTLVRKDRILEMLRNSLHDLSGVDLDQIQGHTTFLEMGFDSLFLTRAVVAFQKEFGLKISFRQLFEEAPTPDALAGYIDDKLPPDALAEDPVVAATEPTDRDASAVQELAPATPWTGPVPGATSQSGSSSGQDGALERVIAQQLQVMAEQLSALRNGGATTEDAPAVKDFRGTEEEQYSGGLEGDQPARNVGLTGVHHEPSEAQSTAVDPTVYGPWKPMEKGPNSGLTSRQREHSDDLIERYTHRTKESKRLVQAYRARLADPRTVSGFRGLWKEMVYPIVMRGSSGSRMWDVDGNEYVDVAMGFGVNLFGHSPDFVTKALQEQIPEGIEIGCQSPMAGKVAELFCEITGSERASYCNTGSEAVLAAIRTARTVTGRDRIAVFSGAYHGIFDGVLVRALTVNGRRSSVPVAPGIPTKMVEDVLVLDYGDPASLDVILAHADELAAVLVEPVQSRNPDLQPKQFLYDLRKVTEESGIALVFDEMITGFRIHPRGAQGWFGVQADIGTYGKIVGGGMPMGIVAGKAAYMDALDGGMWAYGDDSFPEAGVTLFGGTFVHHPLALAAAWATLNHLKEQGPQLQHQLNEKSTRFAEELNDHFERIQAPIHIAHCGSLFHFDFQSDQKFSDLLFYHLREKGVHIWYRPCFLSTAHTDQDIDYIIDAFKKSVAELREGGFIPESPGSPSPVSTPVAQRPSGVADDVSMSQSSRIVEPLPAYADGKDGEVKRDSKHDLPLTESQMEIWLASQFGEEASCSFNLCYKMDLKGRLDLEAMDLAIQQVVDRHETLRTTFSPDGDYQRISPHLTLELKRVDLSRFDSGTREAQVADIFLHESGSPFDLEHGALMRAQIVKLEEEHHILVFTLHHIVCDGFSIRPLASDLTALYSAACQGTIPQLSRPMQYSEYTEWQLEQQETPEYAAAEAYWLEQFAEPAPHLDLPSDRPRPPAGTYPCGELLFARDAYWNRFQMPIQQINLGVP